MNKTNRKDISEFIFKAQKTIATHIKEQSYYKNLDTNKLKEEYAILQKETICNRVKSYAISDNDGKYFLSIDIETANFTVLKEISNYHEQEYIDIDMTWPDYFKQLVPNDCRSTSKRNVMKGLAGLSFDIPNCLYESKHFRQVILGDLGKLKHLWELKNIKLLNSFSKLGLNNPVTVNSDEIIIEVMDYMEADKIIELLSIPKGFRVKKFRLLKIDGFEQKNSVVKVFDDMSKALMNVHPESYDELYKKFIYNDK